MTKNQEIIITIDNISATGSGVGRYENMAVFVPLSAVGDTLRVKILKVKKTYAFAKIEGILTPSPLRTKADCPVFARCGGCVFRHISYEAEKQIKQQAVYDNIKRIGGIDMPPKDILALSRNRYRNKAQYPVSLSGNVGFFSPHSHRIIESDSCPLQPEIFDKICAEFSAFLKEKQIPVYNEEAHTGLVRHLYLRKADKTGEIMVCVVINGKSLPFAEYLLCRLQKLLGEALKSLQININTNKTNVILGDKCEVLYGSEYITDILCDTYFRISPLSFYQVNRDMAELLYKKAAEYAECDNKTIIDLYCGAGTIGLSIGKNAKKIIGVEIVPEAIENAKQNAKLNGINNAEFICGDAAQAAEILANKGITADVVIVDPPRKGCDTALLNTVAKKISPERLVYISCDSATLARDIAVLKTLGYNLIEYTPADLFPATAHTETVCLLQSVSD